MPLSRLVPSLRSAVWLAACALAVPSRAEELRTIAGLDGGAYCLRSWQVEDGLPQNTVTALAQTTDGHLWIGTYGGLARFDGVRFESFELDETPELAGTRIVSLLADADGRLWVGHDTGLLSQYHAGNFAAVPGGSGHRTEGIVSLARARDGEIWLLRRSGLIEPASTGRSLALPARQEAPNPATIFADRGGTLHVLADGRVLRLDEAGDRRPVDFERARQSGHVMAAAPARGDGIWVVRDWRVQRWHDEQLVENRGPCPWGGDSPVTVLLERRDGTLAVGTLEHGLFLLRPDRRWVRIDQSRGLPQNWVRALCEDEEGNLWIGCGSAGLAQLVPARFDTIAPPDQWQGRGTLALLATPDHALWVGTEGAGLYRLHGDSWTRYGPPEVPDLAFVWSLTTDATGALWAGTWSNGLFRLDADQVAPAPAFPAADGPVLALQRFPGDDTLWIGAGRGLLRWAAPGGSAPPLHLGSGADVATCARTPDGALWYGMIGGGLGRFAGGQHRRFRTTDGLPSDSIQALLADADGTLWIGTADAGLCRLRDGKFSTIALRHGLASNTICHIADDGLGHLWLGTHHGIARLARTELDLCADGLAERVNPLVFDRNDGLPTIELAGGLHSAGARSPDGRLWFPTGRGLVTIDPAHFQPNPRPPPVLLRRLRVDERLHDFSAGLPAALELPPDHQRLSFDFTALSFSAPAKVRFRYRLEGVDARWIEADTKRSATYSHLAAGRYTFRVVACNNDGLWNTVGASLPFTVRPYFWQRWWFLGGTGLLALGAVTLAVRRFMHRRMRRRLHELEQRHAVERERSRIAQDIHDDIGAHLTRILMLAQSAAPDDRLRRIYASAHEVTAALDEIVWAINPRHDSLDSLVSYMVGDFARSLLETAGLRCRLDLPVAVPHRPLSAEVRHNLFLAFKEALNNAIRHAGATEVQISLRIDGDDLVLVLADDGRGFAPPADPAGFGNGLLNMRQRLAKIGGRCELDARPGAGTRVSFTLRCPPPAAPA